ncbi:MAG: hypothetical protein FJX68_12310 [Alphaproteobacteria bacterium]|nr:hypothetical protein [Alphaproteobacteria bacterium]
MNAGWLAEALSSLRGALAIALLDPAAERRFNLSLAGFKVAFGAMALVLPPYLLMGRIGAMLAPPEVEPVAALPAMLIDAVAFVIRWFGFVAAMVPLAMAVKAQATYVRFIIFWSWASLLQVTLLLGVAALHASQLLPPGLSRSLLLLAYVAVFFYAFLVARVGLKCSVAVAIIVVLFEVVLNVLVDRGFDAIL